MKVVAVQVSKQREMNEDPDSAFLQDLTSRVYKLVCEHASDGVLQSEVWKNLTLSSRDGSRLAIRLERRGLIRRDKLLDGGRWTYKLTALRMPVHIESIEAVPCITCPYEAKCSLTGVVSPLSCPWLVEWVTNEFRELKPVTPVAKRASPSKIIKVPVAASARKVKI